MGLILTEYAALSQAFGRCAKGFTHLRSPWVGKDQSDTLEATRQWYHIINYRYVLYRQEMSQDPDATSILLSFLSLCTGWYKQFNAMCKVLSGPLVARKS